jgi:hypothetical protein
LTGARSTRIGDRLDADDRVKGKQFEHICKWFLTNDPVYKHELRRVWLWDEWPGRWGADAGIDLVADVDIWGHPLTTRDVPHTLRLLISTT